MSITSKRGNQAVSVKKSTISLQKNKSVGCQFPPGPSILLLPLVAFSSRVFPRLWSLKMLSYPAHQDYINGRGTKLWKYCWRCTHAGNLFYLFTDAQCPVRFIHYVSHPLTSLSFCSSPEKKSLHSKQGI